MIIIKSNYYTTNTVLTYDLNLTVLNLFSLRKCGHYKTQ